MTTQYLKSPLPPRIQLPPWWQQFLFFIFLAFFIASIDGIEITRLSGKDLIAIPHQVKYVFERMFPPSLGRIGPVARSLLQTLEMSIVGNVIGIPISLFLAVFSARNLTPHPVVYYIARAVITFIRTTPSLVWAIFLIVAVGLGPRAGTVTLILATVGFCGRFFAEAMEEIDPGPREALTALGASETGAIFCSVIPDALPSFINTALFNLEHTTRSSAVLGIVGAGGIGIELMVSIKTFHYDEAATIKILVFIMVVAVEQACAAVRRKVL
jgi:phosphonate transport system permease protein